MSDNPFPVITDLLFVYGTLMQGNHNEFASHLHQSSSYLDAGWFSGHLYMIDWYPGATYNSSISNQVWGEVYQLHHPAPMLSYLDEYEGTHAHPSLFVRQIVPVHLENRIVPCQTYLYNLSTENLVPIPSGRFKILT